MKKQTSPKLNYFKTHHYIIFFVRSRHSKPGIELLFNKYRRIIMVGLLLIMRDFHYGRMCCKSVKTLGALHSYLLGRYPIQISRAPAITNSNIMYSINFRGILFCLRNLINGRSSTRVRLRRPRRVLIDTALRSQKAVAAYLKSKRVLPFGFARRADEL